MSAVQRTSAMAIVSSDKNVPTVVAGSPPSLGVSQPSLGVSLASGAAAGALAKTVIAPLDRTKINFQISHTPYSTRAAISFLAATVRTEGVRALWRGNSATMARIVPYAAVQFAAHEQWKRALGVHTQQLAKENKLRHLCAGALAGVTSQSATYPLDVARARMAVAKKHLSLAQVFRLLWRNEGPKAMYRGYWATVLGIIPYAGVSFFTYENLKRIYSEKWGVPATGLSLLACGGGAGALGQTASYPLDIVRRRMQTSAVQADGTYVYSTILVSIKNIYSKEGWRGLFKGLSMNWVKGPLATGVSFATYDTIKGALGRLIETHTLR